MRDFLLKLSERLREAAAPRRQRGQSLVIVAGAFIGLAAMVGLAIDGGILFITQAHLRRAVDSAAVAAATQMRVGQTNEAIQRYAYQFIRMNGVDPTTVLVSFYNYNNAKSGALGPMAIDCHHEGSNKLDPNYDAYGLCEVPQRKLIRVEGRAEAQFSFMGLVGIYTTTVTASAVAEAASVDAVIVLDTSNSMGNQTQSYITSTVLGADSTAAVMDCNSKALVDPKNKVGNCRPLMDAKEAAKLFVRRLYPDYDRVALIHFDFKAHPVVITDTKPQVETTSAVFSYVRDIANPADNGANQGKGACNDLNASPNYHAECDDDPDLSGSQSSGIYRAIDTIPLVHDAEPWLDPTSPSQDRAQWGSTYRGEWNPLDYKCNWATWGTGTCPGHPSGTKGTPVDDWTAYTSTSVSTTCTGCGIRVAGNMLKLNGRPSALWVIVFLSDGGVNATDVPETALPDDPFFRPDINASIYPNGYCGVISGTVNLTGPVSLWKDRCIDPSKVVSFTTRTCGPYNAGQDTCPPGTTYVGSNTPPYDALDYARDMIDITALRVTCPAGTDPIQCAPTGTKPDYNAKEHPRFASGIAGATETTGPLGADVAVYSIGLGSSVAVAGAPVNNAERLLRYMAAVGDDGDRVTDPCNGVPSATSCGNYYYAAQGAQLASVFEDIAKRVFTRLSK